MKKIILTVLLSLVFTLGFLHAQVSADPSDYFYTDLAVWEASGLVGNLPAARPYPLQMVRQILDSVIARGDGEQRRIATAHYNRFFEKSTLIGFKTELGIDVPRGRRQMGVAMSLDSNLFFDELITAGASLDGWAINKLPSDEVLPSNQKSPRDIIPDNAKVGPFYILPSMNSSLAVGNTEYYFNAGLMRGAFGPFPDNGVIVGSQALHSGQYSLAVNKPVWGFNLSLYSLTATPTEASADRFPEKFLSVHSFDFRPFDWLSVSLLESVVYGGRFEPMYILPLSPYMISQGMTGFGDNSLLGGYFSVKPIRGLKIDGVFYADDLSFNDIVRLNFDTKWRLAGQLGATWASPVSGIFTLASLDYTIVTPFMYSHKNGDPINLTVPNYQNYAHAGENFGAALEPNSDRLHVKIKLRPLEGIDFDIVGLMIRHGNINENIPDKYIVEYVSGDPVYITDGSIRNSSGTNGAGHLFNYTTPFLAQDTLQYAWQTGFDALCRLPVLKTRGFMVFKASWRFEYVANAGVGAVVYTKGSSTTEADALNEGREQLKAWKEGACTNTFNNYISAGFEYYF